GRIGEEAAEDTTATGWMQPEAEEESWGGTEWMQQGEEAPAVQEPGVGGRGVPSGAGDVSEQGGAPPDGGSAGGELLSPGLVLGPTDPQTGALIAPSSR